jgi:hypothetical protein
MQRQENGDFDLRCSGRGFFEEPAWWSPTSGGRFGCRLTGARARAGYLVSATAAN